jgi:alkylation response protein AidB-like acyl-CoA dehydrogenase
MNFEVSELTQQVAQSAREFAGKHIQPFVMKWDEFQEFPLHVFKQLGDLGMMGVLVPEEFGVQVYRILNITLLSRKSRNVVELSD